MRTLWPQLATWLDHDEPFALATITSTEGSSPRAVGACMAVQPGKLRFIGAVSSGCLDAEIVEAAEAALRTGGVVRLHFGPEGALPWAAGLTCGGRVSVRVEPWWGCDPRPDVRAVGAAVRRWLERDESGVVVSSETTHCALAAGGEPVGDHGAFLPGILDLAADRLSHELPPVEVAEAAGTFFVRTVRRRPRLVLVGGSDVAVHLVALARQTGWAVTVIDPREAFVREERFPARPEQIIRAWPGEVLAALALGPRDAAVAITHDAKIDDAALLPLLQGKAGYIGALGGKRSHAGRLERLREAGADPAALARIHGPAGLHLGTPDAAGIALGICAGLAQWQAEVERRAAEVGATGAGRDT